MGKDIRGFNRISVKDVGTWKHAFIPDAVSGLEWELATHDLRQMMEGVPIEEMRYLQSKLMAGEIDGRYSEIERLDETNPPCGCFIATIGNHIKTSGAYFNQSANFGQPISDWDAFSLSYHNVIILTPAQEWLRGIHPGMTPENNSIARAFYDELELIIKERG